MDYRKYNGFDYAGVPLEIHDRETSLRFACKDMDDDARDARQMRDAA